MISLCSRTLKHLKHILLWKEKTFVRNDDSNSKDVKNIVLYLFYDFLFLFFAMSNSKKHFHSAFFVTKCSDRSVLFIENSLCMATCRRVRLYSSCFQTQQRHYELISCFFYEGWTTVVWAGRWHRMHAGSFHTSYSHRTSSQSDAVGHWCPGSSVIVLPAAEGAAESLDVSSFYSYVCLFDDDVKETSFNHSEC